MDQAWWEERARATEEAWRAVGGLLASAEMLAWVPYLLVFGHTRGRAVVQDETEESRVPNVAGGGRTSATRTARSTAGC